MTGTDPKLAGADSERSGHYFAGIIDHLPDATFVIDTDGIVIAWNRAIEEMTGVTAHQMLGKGDHEYAIPFYGYRRPILIDLVFESDETLERNYYHIIKKEGDTIIAESDLPRPLGNIVWMWGKASPLYDEAGRKIGAIESIRDITDRKRAEEALRRSEKRLSDIIDHLPDAILAIDRAGKVIAWNRAIEEMTGVRAENMLGKGDYEYGIPFYGRRRPILIDWVFASDAELEKKYTVIRREGNLIVAEVDLVLPDGRNVSLWGKASPLYDEEGRKIGAIESIRDITGHRRAEEAFRQSEERYRSLFENSGSPLTIIDEDNTILLVNREFEKVIGIPRQEVERKRKWMEFVADPRDLETMREYHRLRRTDPGRAPTTYESRVRKPDDTIRDVIVTVALIPGTRQSVAAFADITDRRQAEIALANAKEFAENIIRTANAMIIGLDTAGRITIFNQAAERISGYTRSELAGRNWFDVLVPADRFPQARAEFDRLISGGLPEPYENPIVTKSGELRHIAWQNNEIREQGRIVGTLSIGIDITERMNAEAELRTLYAELEQRVFERTAELRRAEEAYRLANGKLNLLASITRHDILNQLIVLKGFLDLTGKKVQDPVAGDYIRKARNAAAIIERHILFTRLYQNIGVKSPLWQDVKESAARQAAGLLPASVRFSADLQGIGVFADQLFEKVLYTLMDNSIRHGERVTEVHLSFRTSPGSGLVLVYEDNGTGIPAEDKERIFERGFGKNTGFGLFLAREILAITGITIRENGEPGRGARFEITVPEGGWKRSGGRTAGTEDPRTATSGDDPQLPDPG